MPEGFAAVDIADVDFNKGNATAASASRRATLVWVKAAGLMTKPATWASGARWIRSIRAPS